MLCDGNTMQYAQAITHTHTHTHPFSGLFYCPSSCRCKLRPLRISKAHIRFNRINCTVFNVCLVPCVATQLQLFPSQACAGRRRAMSAVRGSPAPCTGARALPRPGAPCRVPSPAARPHTRPLHGLGAPRRPAGVTISASASSRCVMRLALATFGAQ